MSVAWLGGLTLTGLVLCGLAGWMVDDLGRARQLGPATILALEEVVEAAVLAALFGVRYLLSRALFAGAMEDAGRQRVAAGVSETREIGLTG